MTRFVLYLDRERALADLGLSKSGVKLGHTVGQVWTVRNGRIVRDRFFGEDRAACLEAVGLEE